MKKDIIIISLGGSLIVPKTGIDVDFLKKFKKLILKHVKAGKRFILITGGGKTCRDYNEAAAKIVKPSHEDLDWMGIYTTRVNAYLVKTIFSDIAYDNIVENPTKKIDFKEKVLVGSGWKPGCSSDMDAVLLAKNFKVKTVINLSNIKYAYDKDPAKYKDAKPLKNITWKDFRKIVGDKWVPGMNAPFDPTASKLAQELGIRVIIADGKDLKNLEKILDKEKFVGTEIGG